MRSLRSLIDWLPYYFKASDTYLKNGKGLLERYLEIFGNYFDDKVIGDINNLDSVLDVDNTPEVYLGYLWEFLGSMPYANPHAIDPEKWKLIFNGFDSPSTIELLKKYWVYPMNTSANSSSDHFDLTDSQVRSLVKYSVALFSIRGTRRFFEILLRLYGLNAKIGRYSVYPDVTSRDKEDSDYLGTDDNYYGTDDNYHGSYNDSLFDSLTENTKIDTQFSDLDSNCQLDHHSFCSRCVTVEFKLKASDGYVYVAEGNEFKRLYKRMYNLINIFLPLGARPHLIFEDIDINGNIGIFDPKTNRSVEVFLDRMPEQSMSQNIPLVDNGDGWFKFVDGSIAYTSFADDKPLRLKVKVVDEGVLGSELAEDTPKTFSIRFNGLDWSEDFEDGHIFTINPQNYNSVVIKPTSISPSEYNLITWECPITLWFYHVYQYEIFNEQTVGPYKLDGNNPYAVVVVQSYAGRTSTKNEDPSDDSFIGLPVINFTTGLYLHSADDGDIVINIGGHQYSISLDSYVDKHCYVDVITEPGIYEYRQEGRPENFVKIQVDLDYSGDSGPTISRVSGSSSYIVDKDNPTTGLIRYFGDDLHYLLTTGANIVNRKTKVAHISSIDTTFSDLVNSLLPNFANMVAISDNPNYFEDEVTITRDNLSSLVNWEDVSLKFRISYLTKPVHSEYQALVFTLTKRERDIEGWRIIEGSYTILLNPGILVNNTEFISIGEPSDETYLDIDGDLQVLNNYPISCRDIDIRLPRLLQSFFTNLILSDESSLKIELRTLYSPNPIIVDIGNSNRRYNSGEGFYLDDPGLYMFKSFNPSTNKYSSDLFSVNILSNKYNDKYIIELLDDGNTADDEEYMVRMAVPESVNGDAPDTVIQYTFKVRLTLNMSIIDAQDILIADPNAFDFQAIVYRGTTPNNGTMIDTIPEIDFIPILIDDDGNLLPNYTVEAEVTWEYVKGNYTLGEVTVGEGSSARTVNNRPPGVYCFELHDVRKVWPGTPTYRCIDIYEQPLKGGNNLFFDVDVISRAWVKPAAQAYDYDNQGNRTWGFYKTHPDFAYAVRSCRYDPAITEVMPQFRLNLDNNPMGYKRVMMYKLVDNPGGNTWDYQSQYTPIKYKPLGALPDQEDQDYGHWLNEANGGVSDSWKAGINQKWVFTGTVYQLGELITGPQEPGKYIFRIEQLNQKVGSNIIWIDKNPINYAYLEVKEDIQYSIILDPKIAILQGTAVITNVTVVTSSKYTKEDLVIKVTGPDTQLYDEEYKPPLSFYAYQVGTYIFTLYRKESDGTLVQLTSANFKVLSENGISDEYLSWPWSDDSRKLVEVVTTSNDIVWTVKVQDE